MCQGRYRCCSRRRSFFQRNNFKLWLRFWIILIRPRTPICARKLDHSNSKQKHTHKKLKSWTWNLILLLTVWIWRVSKSRNLQKNRILETSKTKPIVQKFFSPRQNKLVGSKIKKIKNKTQIHFLRCYTLHSPINCPLKYNNVWIAMTNVVSVWI